MDRALDLIDKLIILNTNRAPNKIDQPLLTSNSCSTSIKINSFTFPLESVQEAKQLDLALCDKKFNIELKDRLLNNIGRNDGEVNGHYLNIMGNQLFTNVLLNAFTYKGIARGGVKKESFSGLRNVMAFFQSFLFDISPIFDANRTEKYVQTKLLRHSGSRIKRL